MKISRELQKIFFETYGLPHLTRTMEIQSLRSRYKSIALHPIRLELLTPCYCNTCNFAVTGAFVGML